MFVCQDTSANRCFGRRFHLNRQIVHSTVLWEHLYHISGKCTCIFVCHCLWMNGDLQDRGAEWVTPSSFFKSVLRCTDSDLWLCKACDGCLDFNFITGCDECYTALSLWSNGCMLENAPVLGLPCLMLFITKCLDSCVYLPHHLCWNYIVRFLFRFFSVL
jgi:hypothetical protein